MTNTAPFVQVCNVDHIETFLGSASSYQNSVVTWIFRYLQFSCKSAQPLSGVGPLFCSA